MLSRSYLPQDSRKDLLAYSPMLHARLFNSTEKYRNEHFQPTKSSLTAKTTSDQPRWLDGNPDTDRPLFVQFCANKPDELLGAAEYVAPYVDAVDLNLGCPQGIARSGHYGAFLQEDWDTIYKLINRLHKELSIPVTAKMRILETPEQTLDYAKMILSAGASILTVHGRRREQKGHNTGLADWSILRFLRDNLPPETVLFANGNILNHGDLQRCLDATGFDGVMSAEANLNDPTVFAEPPTDVNDREYWRGPDGTGGYRIDGVVRRYFDIIYRHVLEQTPPVRPPLYLPGDDVPEATVLEPSTESEEQRVKSKKRKREKGSIMSPNLKVMQGHLFGMLRAVVGTHTDIRDALARSKYGEMHNFERVLQMLEKAVRAALDQEAAKTAGGDAESSETSQLDDVPESERTLASYRRPWWVCQPFIRPSPEEAIAKGALKAKKRDIAHEDADIKRPDEVKRQRVEEPVDPIVREDRPEVVDEANNAPAAAVVCG
jgi:tRNA-dihydrouridine synthase 1